MLQRWPGDIMKNGHGGLFSSFSLLKHNISWHKQTHCCAAVFAFHFPANCAISLGKTQLRLAGGCPLIGFKAEYNRTPPM